ncbi:hypothetical protein U1Q18_002052 [Sarracenia purpurea var. burkii]
MAISNAADQNQHETQNPRPTGGPPHEAVFLAVPYFSLFELLAASEVCKPLRDAVMNDPLPWLDLTVKKPLNLRISDDILVRIALRANGRLRTLDLIHSVKITDDGLRRVVQKNPLVSKLHVPGCTGLTPDGVIRAVKTLTDQQNHNLVSLKINGIYNIKQEHLDALRSILEPQEIACQIDVDICPKCNLVRPVFNCPRQSCERKRRGLSECKGCSYCIPRCVECERCVGFEEEEDTGDTACGDTLCSECWLQHSKCNFCNRPYCNQHADQCCNLPGSSGFVCIDCHMNFLLV